MKIFLVIALLVLLMGSVFAGSVSRSFSTASVDKGKDVTVNLTINVDNETFFAIDETIPNGWIVKEAGLASTAQSGHLKWAIIENAEDTTYSYTLTAPAQAGTAEFSGKYMLEGMTAEAEIAGQKTVAVSEPQTNVNGNNNGNNAKPDLLENPMILGIILLAAFGIAFFVLNKSIKKKKKK